MAGMGHPDYDIKDVKETKDVVENGDSNFVVAKDRIEFTSKLSVIWFISFDINIFVHPQLNC